MPRGREEAGWGSPAGRAGSGHSGTVGCRSALELATRGRPCASLHFQPLVRSARHCVVNLPLCQLQSASTASQAADAKCSYEFFPFHMWMSLGQTQWWTVTEILEKLLPCSLIETGVSKATCYLPDTKSHGYFFGPHFTWLFISVWPSPSLLLFRMPGKSELARKLDLV